jgi:hypothetical protein
VLDYYDAPRGLRQTARAHYSKETNVDYLLGFDKMISPVIIRIIYFLSLLGVVIGAGLSIFQGSLLRGLAILVFGALIVRIYCELLILLFRIYDNLVEINAKMKKSDLG